MRPVLETIHRVGQARGGLGQVRGVDLLDVAQADDLGAGAGTGDQRLHLLRGEVLRLVQDQVARQEGTAAHEVHRADLDAAGQQVVGGLAAPGAAFLVVREHFQVVGQRAHPRRHLLLLGARQETDVLADADRGAGHDDLAVALLVHRLRQAGGQCQQGLAGTGGAQQGDEVDLRIHQCVEREVLLAVARTDTPDGVAAVAEIIDQRQHYLAVADHAADAQFDFVFAGQVDVLVRVPLLAVLRLDFVMAAALVAPAAQVVAVALPEVFRQLGGAGVEQAEIVQRAVVFVVLGHDAGDGGLDSQVDVLGNEHHRQVRRFFLQRQDRAKDGIVGNDLSKALARVEVAGLEAQLAGALLAAQLQAVGALQRNAVGQVVQAGFLHQLVEEAAHLAGVAARFGGALLAVVQLLDHLHGQVDVVLLEFEQRGRIVHQHVGIQHVDALASGHRRFLVTDREKPPRPAAGQGDGRHSRQWDSLGLGGLQFGENGIGMAGNLDLAPGLHDAAVGGNQEGAAFDATYLLAVHVLHPDHVEGGAQRFVAIADQREVEALPGTEVVVRLHRVARDAEHDRAGLLELRQQGVEVDAFGGAAGSAVLGVEVQHQPLAGIVAESGLVATGQRQRQGEGGAVQGIAVVHEVLLSSLGCFYDNCMKRHAPVRGARKIRTPNQNFIGSMIASRFRWSQNSRKSSRSAAMCMLAGTPMVTCALNISAPVCMAR